MNYQAAVTALIAVHIATGRRISWADSLLPEPPISLSAETCGGGDDIRVDFESGYHAEMQVKKGLRRGAILWSALENLARGIEDDPNEVGVLVVCDAASSSVRNELRKDIERIGDGRHDALKEISSELVKKLEQLGLSPQKICARLRIFVVDAADITSQRVQTALRDLEGVCSDGANATKAWDALNRDSARVIEIRGRRDIVSIERTLRSADVRFREGANEPTAALAAVCEFNIQTNADLTIPGYNRALPIEEVWISTRVKAWEEESPKSEANYETALAQYHKSIEAKHSESTFDVEWLGRFVRHAVVVGGPGAGKSTAAKMLARRYSLDGYPVLKMPLRQVAKRLENGDGFWEALVSLGLDGSGIDAAKIGISFPWVIVADGLDECGAQKLEVSEKLANLAKNHPQLRIIVTTRPIGYASATLTQWRHYRMLAQDDTAAGTSLTQLVGYLSGDKVKLEDRLVRLEDVDSDLSEAIRRTPLVLALSAVLLADGQPLATTKAGQYAAILKRVEERNKSRADDQGLSDPILRHALNAIGEHLISSPLSTTAQTIAFAVGSMSSNLDLRKLQSEDQVQRAISYWKDIGILEEITHGDNSYLAFIHRSFAEFASARYLIETVTTSDAIDGVIRERVSDSKWAEVVDFVGYLEWANAVIRHLVYDFSLTSISAEKVEKSLKVAAFSHIAIGETERSELFDCALKLGETGRRDVICIISSHLLKAAGRYPQHAQDIGSKLSQSEKPWARLLGWTLLLERQHAISISLEALSDVPTLVDTILKDRDRDTTGVMNLDRSPNRLIELFSVRLIDSLAVEHDGEELIKLIAPIIELRDQLSLGFQQAIQSCLRRHGLVDSFQKSSFESGLNTEHSARLWADAFRESLLQMFAPFLNLLASEQRSKVGPNRDQTHLQMSAILHITDFWHMSLGDIAGTKDEDLAAAEQEVVRGLLNAAELDLDTLVSEIMDFEESIARQPDVDFRLFDRTVHVDCEIRTWSVDLSPPLDLEQLSKSMRESSLWMARVATALIYANADEFDLEAIAKQAVAHRTLSSLSMASDLTERMSKTRAVSMLLEAAAHYDTDVSPILSSLASKANWDSCLGEIVERHLLGKSVENAISATAILLSLAPRDGQQVVALAREAYEHWHKNEEPYPKQGGTIPPSPRDQLIELVDLGNWGDERLFEACCDLRSEVRKWAVAILIEKLDAHASLQAELLLRCKSDDMPISTLRDILRGRPYFDQSTAINLAKYLLNHHDKKWRYLGLAVVELDCVKDQQKEELLCDLNDEQPVEIIARAERIQAVLAASNS